MNVNVNVRSPDFLYICEYEIQKCLCCLSACSLLANITSCTKCDYCAVSYI